MRRIAALALLLWLAAGARDALDAWVDATVLPPLGAGLSVEVRGRDGDLLRAFTAPDGRWRLAVDPTAVDPAYLDLLIAYEDRRFYSHSGVDPLALIRATGQAVMQGRVVSGGSTLTMQVARLLEASGTGRWAGKLRQIRLALALERRLSKSEILALYLHRAPFGGNLEGVRAASFAWFGKEPRRLTEAEAALLVALPQAPELRRPDRNPAAARAGRDRVLARMVAQGRLSEDQATAARSERIPDVRRPFPAHAPHLAERLVRAAPLRPLHQTTLDPGLQRQLEALARDAVGQRGARLSLALVVADHGTGEVLASVGAAEYGDEARQGFVDMTRALRSPGSTLKPFVYALAFDDGLAHPETLIEDRPTRFGDYAPQNFDRLFRGTIRLRDALQLSLNIPVVALAEALGPARIPALARRAGVDLVVPGGQPGLAVVLGGAGVHLEGMVQLYAGLARGGRAITLSHAGPGAEGARLMGPVAAWQVADILASAPPPPGAPRNRLAYKTGTSYGHRDAWALGFDGRHVVGVWMGRADGTPVPGAFGADSALPVLFQAFARLKPALDPLPPPPGATLVATTAQLPAPLQRFRGREGALSADADAPAIAFPPDGAVMELDGPLVARVAGGEMPYSWLADGRPVALRAAGRDVVIEDPGSGFVTLTVIDARGRAARAQVSLR
ncbi:penicillin-binding protein 1C [Plastorhodobacter daqingensis]|uniref:peptidoglycan glycosyltransferase n=1 Tax=Plastorhodobacter daqingensis TaxID=1387281 RepID=A0ABW2UM74_9RHOB